MIIYADITFINNFLMTLAIIWAVGYLLDFKIFWWRLLSSSLIGTIYLFIVLFIHSYYIPGWLNLFLNIILNLLASTIMVKIAYGHENKRKVIKGIGYLYLISFITIGTTLSLFYILGSAPFSSGKVTLFGILGLLVLYLLAKFGWRLFNNYITPDIFYVPVEITLMNKEVNLTGLVDTGNSLTDPITHVPVIVVDIDEIIPLFSKELQGEILNNKGGFINLIDVFNEHGLGNRIRILPFTDLGQEHGLLIGLRPDKIKINYQGDEIETKKVIIAISQNKLDEEDEYQVLIHPQILQFSM